MRRPRWCDGCRARLTSTVASFKASPRQRVLIERHSARDKGTLTTRANRIPPGGRSGPCAQICRPRPVCENRDVTNLQLAQLNVARLRVPLDHPSNAAFVNAIDRVNALADAAQGFVWRLQADGGDATSIRIGDDDLVIVNMSLWESIDALWAYVYGGGHLEVMRHRREWFDASLEAHLVLWWREVGEAPDVDEAMQRLSVLRKRGPTAEAFTFRQAFARDGRPISPRRSKAEKAATE